MYGEQSRAASIAALANALWQAEVSQNYYNDYRSLMERHLTGEEREKITVEAMNVLARRVP